MSPNKKEIGDPLEQVARTGKIGGSLNVQKSKPPATQTSSNSDLQTSRSPSFQQSESLATQTSRLSEVQVSNNPDLQTSRSLDFQQSRSLATQTSRLSEVQVSNNSEGKTSRVQRTIYLSPEVAKWIKIRAAIEGREISELAETAFMLYRRQVEGEKDGD